jgi:hypothetical protein
MKEAEFPQFDSYKWSIIENPKRQERRERKERDCTKTNECLPNGYVQQRTTRTHNVSVHKASRRSSRSPSAKTGLRFDVDNQVSRKIDWPSFVVQLLCLLENLASDSH